jgi:hypothetical protein
MLIAFTDGTLILKALRAVRFFATRTLDETDVATFFIARRTAGDAVGTVKAFTRGGALRECDSSQRVQYSMMQLLQHFSSHLEQLVL